VSDRGLLAYQKKQRSLASPLAASTFNFPRPTTKLDLSARALQLGAANNTTPNLILPAPLTCCSPPLVTSAHTPVLGHSAGAGYYIGSYFIQPWSTWTRCLPQLHGENCKQGVSTHHIIILHRLPVTIPFSHHGPPVIASQLAGFCVPSILLNPRSLVLYSGHNAFN